MTESFKPSRREVLRLAPGLALASAAYRHLPSPPAPERRPRRSSPAERQLVVLELSGGNDGLSVMSPMSSGRYHDARPTTANSPDDLLDLGDGYGLHTMFEPLRAGGLTLLAGVGDHRASMSHFDMLDRWWQGTPDRSSLTASGFLGRVCDRLGRHGHVGVSIGPRPTRGFLGSRSTTSITDTRPIDLAPGLPSAQRAARTALHSLGRRSEADGPTGYERGIDSLLGFDRLLHRVEPPPSFGVEGPGADMAARFETAAQLIGAGLGIRVVHLAVDNAPFDTHIQHTRQWANAWQEVLPGLTAFLDHLRTIGRADQVLVATTSEFGRRFAEHNGGIDHGSASCAMLMGPLRGGVVGEHPSLRKLDDDGNQIATVSFSRYLASLAAWLDVDPAAVLERAPRPIAGLVPV